ncbi:MAG: hypothetical protein AB1327_03415 [Bacillota bacterium]|uniref:hypothetical protein n=1 Tax=Desulforudis sp. DRI-14 TaxID=3459793 RepID=UPI0034780590
MAKKNVNEQMVQAAVSTVPARGKQPVQRTMARASTAAQAGMEVSESLAPDDKGGCS